MLIIKDIQQAKQLCQQWRDKGERIAFIPTMGCLHAGHLSLVEKAQSLDSVDRVVVSIFVNPLQFDDKNDLLKYPNTLDDDVGLLDNYNVDLVFAPNAAEFYPEGEDTVSLVELGAITGVLEGAMRPGHFAGVATVVKRLFDLIQPNIAIFGEKDFQQLMVVQKLVKQFSLDIELIGMPTFREANGLAMSSRNLRLSDSQRDTAGTIYQILTQIRTDLREGKSNFAELEQMASNKLTCSGFETDYVAIREVSTLLPPQKPDSEMVILIAAKLGNVRLIDNLRV